MTSSHRNGNGERNFALDGKGRGLIDGLRLGQVHIVRGGVIGCRRAQIRQSRAKGRNAGRQINRRAELRVGRNKSLSRVEPLRRPLSVVNRNLAMGPAVRGANDVLLLPRGFQVMLSEGRYRNSPAACRAIFRRRRQRRVRREGRWKGQSGRGRPCFGDHIFPSAESGG